MKDYNLEYLPKSFGIDTKKEENHPRLYELKSIFEDKFKEEPAFQFIGIDNCGRWNSWGEGSFAGSLAETISIDTFFALIETLELDETLNLTEGSYLFCFNNRIKSEVFRKINICEILIVSYCTSEVIGLKNKKGEISRFLLSHIELKDLFRNATPEEIVKVKNNTIGKDDSIPTKAESEPLLYTEKEYKDLQDIIALDTIKLENLVKDNRKLLEEASKYKQQVSEAKKRVAELFTKQALNYKSIKGIISMISDSRTHFVKHEMCSSANNIIDQNVDILKRLVREFKDFDDLSSELPF